MVDLKKIAFASGIGAMTAMLLGSAQPPAKAADRDHPEPGRQGEILPGEARILPQPYSRGVRLIGHEPLGGRTGNIQLAWMDRCAYVSSTLPGLPGGMKANDPRSGVAVIDVSDPRAPRQVGLLRDHGAIQTTETIHAVSAPGRKVLVAGSYAGGNAMFGPHDPPYLDIYDVSDCKKPKLMAEYVWPENAHTVTVSPDGRFVYGTSQSQTQPFTGHGGLQVLDISDMTRPRYIGRLKVEGPDGRLFEFAPHEVSVSPDGRRIYAGVTDSTSGDLNPGLKEGFNLERTMPETGGIYILDNSDIVDGKPDPRLRLISQVRHGGWHLVMQANIDGVPYLVGGGELSPCPGAVPQIVNIADEKHPFIKGQFHLAMNRPDVCPPGPPSMKSFGAPYATLHYNDVDSATRTRLGLFNFTVAGLRIADLRDPANPTEVAYFRPGDMCTGHVRYQPKSSQIWFICNESGFWVIGLAPDVPAGLGLNKALDLARGKEPAL
ncbi:MAG TPA: hypothetical protein VF503_28700 [Sphingobium sp.]|uniref:LVIVD repeat-containing protein n=1 Tax=Sphingobium sp. TaxID=1912891 RepID=UPI002ED2DC41